MARVSVALVDAHPLFVHGLSRLFDRTAAFEIVATGFSAEHAPTIAARHQPNLLILDTDPGREAGALISAVQAASRTTKLIAVTATPDVDCAVRAFEAGASGYVLKSSPLEDFKAAVEVVLNGGTFINPSFAAQVVVALRAAALRKASGKAMCLSVREQQIVRLLLQGRTNQEIANSLSISVKTVKHYMTLLMQKLRARNRLEVVIAAQKMDGFQQSTPVQRPTYN